MDGRKRLRLNRLFRDGAAVCVAADHGLMSDPSKNADDALETVATVAASGADGLLLSPGQARSAARVFAQAGAPALLLRIDWMNALRLGKANNVNSLPSASLKNTMLYSVEHAVSVGATAVVVYYVVGYNELFETQSLKNCAMVAEHCVVHGLPLVLEPLLISGKTNGSRDTEMLVDAARMARELGADLLKIPYTGDPRTFRDLVRAVDIPVLVLGGAKSDREEDGYEMVQEALEAGAAGVVFGRKVVNSPDPGQVVQNLVRLVHGRQKAGDLFESTTANSVISFDRRKCTGCRICVNACSSRWHTPRLVFEADRGVFGVHACSKCGSCQEVCRKRAIRVDRIVSVSEACDGCGQCVDACPQGILSAVDGRLAFCSYCDGFEQCLCVEWCPTKALHKEVLEACR